MSSTAAPDERLSSLVGAVFSFDMDDSAIEYLTPEQAENILSTYGRILLRLEQIDKNLAEAREELRKAAETQSRHEQVLDQLRAVTGLETKEFKMDEGTK